MNIKEFLKCHTLKAVAGGFALGLVVCGAFAVMMSVSGSPAFCGGCHAMKHEAATFAMSSHRELDCTECHLPHDNKVHYFVEKGRTGMVDTYHAILRDYPAKIKISAKGRQTVAQNCLRCHSATMSEVALDMKGMDSDCLKCHIRMPHGSNHLEGGIKIE